MNSFRMYFSQDLRGTDVGEVLRETGFDVRAERFREVQVAGPENGHLWIDLRSRSELDPEEEIAQPETWTMSPELVSTLAVVSMKTNDAASALAVRAAHRLVAQFGAMISWDGLFGLEGLYKSYDAESYRG